MVVFQVVISEVIEIIEESNCSSAADVDSMDSSLVTLKRSAEDPPESLDSPDPPDSLDSRGPSKSTSRTRSSTKHRRVVSASPRGRHSGLPTVAKNRPS